MGLKFFMKLSFTNKQITLLSILNKLKIHLKSRILVNYSKTNR